MFLDRSSFFEKSFDVASSPHLQAPDHRLALGRGASGGRKLEDEVWEEEEGRERDPLEARLLHETEEQSCHLCNEVVCCVSGGRHEEIWSPVHHLTVGCFDEGCDSFGRPIAPSVVVLSSIVRKRIGAINNLL